MKKSLLVTLLLCFTAFLFAQAPTLFKYQGVARGINQQPYANTDLGLKISIVLDNGSGTGAGEVQYAERHLTFTSPVGIFSLNIGNGDVLFGDLEEINWGSGSYWLKVEMDVEGGDDYLYMGNSPILPVPLAVHAMTVEDKDDADANPENELQTISFNPNTNELTISNGNTINIPAGQADADADPQNELQTLQFNEGTNVLSLTNGGQVDLSTLEGGAGNDDQTLELQGTTLSIEGGNQVDLAGLQDGTEDADANPANELQTISFDPNTNELTISDGNTINIPAGQADADADPQNELQDLELNGTTLSIEDGNAVDLAALQDGTEDADADPNNELQTIEFNEGTNMLSLTDGGQVDLSSLEGGAGSDDQTLDLQGTTLSIEGGNQVDLAGLQDGTEDADANPANELQTISFDPNTNELTISDGNTINIPAGQADADADPLNEIQSLALNGTTLSIEDGNAVDLAALQDGTEDADADPNNELQTIEFNEGTNMLSLTDGGQVDLSSLEGGAGSDDQTLDLQGTTLSIEGGNQVDLVALQDGTEDADADPNNELQTIEFNEGTNMLSLTDGGQVDLSSLEGGAGSDDQTLDLQGTTLSIEGGNQVDLAALQDGTEDADANPANELQDLQLNGTTLSIENGNQVNLAALQDGTEDADADPNNELQTLQFNEGTNMLSLTDGGQVDLSSLEGGVGSDNQTLDLQGTTLFIEDGNQVDLAGLQDGTEDADANPANELQDLQLNGTTLSIENGNQVNLAALQDGTEDADADPTNELQTIQFDPNTNDLMISGGNTINLPLDVDDNDHSPTNELQTISLNGNNLLLSNGGGQVDLSGLGGGSSLWTEFGNNNIYSLDDVAIGFSETMLSTLEVKDDMTIRKSNGNATIDLFSATNGGNINVYRGNGQGGSNDLLASLGTTSAGGMMNLRSDAGIMGEFNATSGGATLRLYNSGNEETVALSSFSSSSSLVMNQPDGDNSIIFGASSFGGIGTFFGASSDAVASIGRDPGNTDQGLVTLFDASGNAAVTVSGEEGGQIVLSGSVSDNVLIGTESNSSNLGKVSVVSSFNSERAGMYTTGLNQGVIFADVKNFRIDHPEQEDKEIWYACVEGPEAAAYERGTAELVNGVATITFPDHFGLVANHETMTVMLTPLSADCKGLAVIEKTATGFTVKELFQGTGTYQFDWEVKCVRKGYENYQPVRPKKDRL